MTVSDKTLLLPDVSWIVRFGSAVQQAITGQTILIDEPYNGVEPQVELAAQSGQRPSRAANRLAVKIERPHVGH
jgi:hypothetical protein